MNNFWRMQEMCVVMLGVLGLFIINDTALLLTIPCTASTLTLLGTNSIVSLHPAHYCDARITSVAPSRSKYVIYCT